MSKEPVSAHAATPDPSASVTGTDPVEATPIEATESCRYCWMCRHVCPVGHVTQRETLTPHGWALMIASVKRGTLQWNAETAAALYACADCGLCRAHCVTDQPLPEAIVSARAGVAAAGIAPPEAYALHESLRAWGSRYGARDRRVPQAQGDVGIFVSDTALHAAPHALDAARRLLDTVGVHAVPVAFGRSNGHVASALGFPDTAAALARAVLDDVDAAGCRTLLVLGAEDQYAFERLYRERLYHERLGLDWPADVAIVSVSTVLADAHANGRLAFHRLDEPPPYAYHDPCHAPRIAWNAAAPRALLRAVLGADPVELFWRGSRAHPCGAIGGLEVTQPLMAARLAEARLADAAASGARWLIADDPGCLQNLTRHRADGVEVRGFYELLAERLAS